MPLKGSKATRFDEFRHGATYAKTRAKSGKKKANKQMVAAVLTSMRGGKKKKAKKKK